MSEFHRLMRETREQPPKPALPDVRALAVQLSDALATEIPPRAAAFVGGLLLACLAIIRTSPADQARQVRMLGAMMEDK